VTDKITWPDNKQFAFSIFDDTDYASVENVGPVYSFLDDLGITTTKSVWPIKGMDQPRCGGATCEDSAYLEWLQSLQKRGFEIAYHGATFHTSARADIDRALERFRELFGQNPRSMANHSENRENIYWGSRRLTGANRLAYNLLTGFRYSRKYLGHVENSPHFWGDLCRERVKYVRNFIYPETNTLKACPSMPYHDPSRPYVNYWFAASEGPEIESFNRTLSEQAQDELEIEGGACLMYTHLACGFCDNEVLNRRFTELMTRLSKKNGWFAPVGTLLDYLLEKRGRRIITPAERRRLERKWLAHKIRVGRS